MSEISKNKNYLWAFSLIGGLAAGAAAIALVVPVIKRKALRATNILKKDHSVVDGLFWALDKAPTAGARQAIFNRLRKELDLHTLAEEEIFYPAVRNLRVPSAELEVDESFSEHKEVRDLCRELAYIDPDSLEFGLRIRELKAMVEHHVQEEENEMFPLAQRALSNVELERLGTQIQNRKIQLKERMAA